MLVLPLAAGISTRHYIKSLVTLIFYLVKRLQPELKQSPRNNEVPFNVPFRGDIQQALIIGQTD